ncbi:hypothetical protein AVDCRST_MAG82-1568 [uncultured Rubrobacteraceae bacterium]|uniref:Uncharacterized protein n=1 Tax=uncultured Rubrobacteraceae bacterium TaxID=349277 RepID=A0A6J4PY38_9ACTN|nr:hypothetical protein AVDCRST_MAG82-1568 [uncultured Rubrobacteraceae bacterium]
MRPERGKLKARPQAEALPTSEGVSLSVPTSVGEAEAC